MYAMETDNKEMAELYRAGEKMKEWFVDHWQKIARVLEVAGGVHACVSDEVFRSVMSEVVGDLKVIDPQPRLVELDRCLNVWRGSYMKMVADMVKPRPQANLEDPGQLLGQIVLLNARLTTQLARVLLNEAKPSEVDELRSMVDNLAELSKEGAPWQD